MASAFALKKVRIAGHGHVKCLNNIESKWYGMIDERSIAKNQPSLLHLKQIIQMNTGN